MLSSDWRVAFFRHAFLRHAPQRYALMLAPEEAQRLGQKYTARHGAITDAMIAHHLNGAITLAAPAALAGHARLLPLDIDAGGLDAINALLAEIRRRELWGFGQYALRAGLPEKQQRGYVWLPFDTMANTARLQALGTQLIAAAGQPEWKVESRAFHAVTRLPLARHQQSGRFGELVVGDRHINIDQDSASALAALSAVYRENPAATLPTVLTVPPPASRPTTRHGRQSISIERFNQVTHLDDLLRHYGARPSGRRGLYFCPFHVDEHASLSVYVYHGQRYCRCFSAHSHCPLAQHHRNDAFNVYCIGESLNATEALRGLNRG
jgi:hypothetical protein